VVANEVKELAKQTATATEEISRKVEAIQVDAKEAVESIKTISGIIDHVNQISSTIAAAVEEQSATTSEMSRNFGKSSSSSSWKPMARRAGAHPRGPPAPHPIRKKTWKSPSADRHYLECNEPHFRFTFQAQTKCLP
jgi:hypothetical protein